MRRQCTDPGAKPKKIRPGEQKTSPETTTTSSEDEKYEVCFKKVGPVKHYINSLIEGTRIMGNRSLLSRSFTPAYLSGCTNVSYYLGTYLNVGKLPMTVTDRIIYNVLWLALYFRNWNKLRPNTIQFFGLLHGWFLVKEIVWVLLSVNYLRIFSE